MFCFLELFLLAATYLTLKNQNQNKSPEQFCWNSPTNCSIETKIRHETCLPQKNFGFERVWWREDGHFEISCSSWLGAGPSEEGAEHSEVGRVKGAPTARACPGAFPSTGEGAPLVPSVSFAPGDGCWASQGSPCAVRFLCSWIRRCFFLTLLEYAVNYILKYPYTFPLRGSYEQGSR